MFYQSPSTYTGTYVFTINFPFHNLVEINYKGMPSTFVTFTHTCMSSLYSNLQIHKVIYGKQLKTILFHKLVRNNWKDCLGPFTCCSYEKHDFIMLTDNDLQRNT